MKRHYLLFFILLFGALTLKTAAPDVSMIGKLSGGIFVYLVSVMDAYRTARLRYAIWSQQAPDQPCG